MENYNKIRNSINFKYEYYIEDEDGVMKKVEDSNSLSKKSIDEEEFRRDFDTLIKDCKIKGYVDRLKL